MVTDFAKITAPSFETLVGRLSIPAASKMSKFFNGFRTIFPVVGLNWILVFMSKSLQKFFTELILYLFGVRFHV